MNQYAQNKVTHMYFGIVDVHCYAWTQPAIDLSGFLWYYQDLSIHTNVAAMPSSPTNHCSIYEHACYFAQRSIMYE